ncbi:MAG: DUF58 domain-containing protein [Gemmatimonadaceae bacterium]
MEIRSTLRRLTAVITRYAPQPRLALLLAVTCPLWALPSPFGKYAGASAVLLLVIATAVDFLLVPTRTSISIEREFPGNVGIGDETTGTYIIGNSNSRGIVLELRDQLPTHINGGIGTERFNLAAQSMHRFETKLSGMARGSAPLGPIGMRVTTRLGLVSATYRIETEDSIRVIPSVSGVRRFRLLAMQHRLSTLGVRVLRRKGGGQAFANLREYVRGDDPRYIDWKATSKKDKLITREFTVERSQTVMTLIDAGRGMTQLSGTFARFEHALSAALILTDIASNSGDRVGTMVFDDEVRAYVPPQSNRSALQLVRDAFVPVVATSREPDYATAFRFLAAHQGKRALIVFFTDVIDIRASQALIAYVSRSTARHLVLVVALRNDSLFAAANLKEPTSSTSLFETAAAEEVIGARDEALHRMRRAGVIVLDVSPQTMTAAVVNQYLELKGRGAL